MFFFWETAASSVFDYKCPYCGQIQPSVGGRITICSCPKSVQAEIESRQRQINAQRALNTRKIISR